MHRREVDWPTSGCLAVLVVLVLGACDAEPSQPKHTSLPPRVKLGEGKGPTPRLGGWGTERLAQYLDKPHSVEEDSPLTQANFIRHRNRGWGRAQIETVLGPNTGWRGYPGAAITKLREARNSALKALRPLNKKRRELQRQLRDLYEDKAHAERKLRKSEEQLRYLEQRGVYSVEDQEQVERMHRIIRALEFGHMRSQLEIRKLQPQEQKLETARKHQWRKAMKKWRLLRKAVMAPVRRQMKRRVHMIKEHMHKVVMEKKVKAAIHQKEADEAWAEKIAKGHIKDRISVEIYEAQTQERNVKIKLHHLNRTAREREDRLLEDQAAWQMAELNGVMLKAGQPCNDGNTKADDGCSIQGAVEIGWECIAGKNENTKKEKCRPVCGDGRVVGAEQCDDGENESGDGCSEKCTIEKQWSCAGGSVVSRSTCEKCGDGGLRGAEQCDDGNDRDGDGCSAQCTVDAGYVCFEGWHMPSICVSSRDYERELDGQLAYRKEVCDALGPDHWFFMRNATTFTGECLFLPTAVDGSNTSVRLDGPESTSPNLVYSHVSVSKTKGHRLTNSDQEYSVLPYARCAQHQIKVCARAGDSLNATHKCFTASISTCIEVIVDDPQGSVCARNPSGHLQKKQCVFKGCDVPRNWLTPSNSTPDQNPAAWCFEQPTSPTIGQLPEVVHSPAPGEKHVITPADSPSLDVQAMDAWNKRLLASETSKDLGAAQATQPSSQEQRAAKEAKAKKGVAKLQLSLKKTLSIAELLQAKKIEAQAKWQKAWYKSQTAINQLENRTEFSDAAAQRVVQQSSELDNLKTELHKMKKDVHSTRTKIAETTIKQRMAEKGFNEEEAPSPEARLYAQIDFAAGKGRHELDQENIVGAGVQQHLAGNLLSELQKVKNEKAVAPAENAAQLEHDAMAATEKLTHLQIRLGKLTTSKQTLNRDLFQLKQRYATAKATAQQANSSVIEANQTSSRLSDLLKAEVSRVELLKQDIASNQKDIQDQKGVIAEKKKLTIVCGDGLRMDPEACDDGNLDPGDGCSPSCSVEDGWTCETPRSRQFDVCKPVCGDGKVMGSEECDSGSKSSGMGCNRQCKVEKGWSCVGGTNTSRSVCGRCGDGRRSGPEECDDGGIVSGDGCSAECKIEVGFVCSTFESQSSQCLKQEAVKKPVWVDVGQCSAVKASQGTCCEQQEAGVFVLKNPVKATGTCTVPPVKGRNPVLATVNEDDSTLVLPNSAAGKIGKLVTNYLELQLKTHDGDTEKVFLRAHCSIDVQYSCVRTRDVNANATLQHSCTTNSVSSCLNLQLQQDSCQRFKELNQQLSTPLPMNGCGLASCTLPKYLMTSANGPLRAKELCYVPTILVS